MTEAIWHHENEALIVDIFADAATTITDKATGTVWHMGRVAIQEDNPIDVGHVWLRTQRSLCEEYPGRFQAEVAGDTLRFTLLGRERRVVGHFSCRVQLDGAKLVVHLLDIDEAIPSLSFPPPLNAESLVFPSGVGRWVRKPLEQRYTWRYPGHLNMRWFGGLKGDHGWIAIVENGYTDGGVLATGLSASPLWLKSLDSWSGQRTITYQFVSGGYVALAKTFRAYAQQKGLHRSLAEKIAEIPATANLHGAPLLSFMQSNTYHAQSYEERLLAVPEETKEHDGQVRVMVSHAEVKQVLDQVRDQGLANALVVIRGWAHGGYDEFHPDIWPPEPALGSIDELQHLLQYHDTITTALHDNYQDIYQQSPSWPRGVIRTRRGDPMPGGLWAGGQAYILNAEAGLAYAQHNWNELATLKPRSMFIDTTIAVQFYESYEQGHTQTRGQDEAAKLALLRFYKERGQVLGSEEGADFGVPLVDWIENRHHRVPGESIPLWPLVFHDAAFCARYGPGPLSAEHEQGSAPRWLTDMLWGYMLIWGFPDHGKGHLPAITKLQHVYDWHRKIGIEEMVNHRYLTEDGQVEETTFDSAAIIANFSPEARTVNGITIPAHDFIIS